MTFYRFSRKYLLEPSHFKQNLEPSESDPWETLCRTANPWPPLSHRFLKLPQFNPYPWIFGTITERVFRKKKPQHRNIYKSSQCCALDFFFANHVMVPRFGFFPGFTDKGEWNIIDIGGHALAIRSNFSKLIFWTVFLIQKAQSDYAVRSRFSIFTCITWMVNYKNYKSFLNKTTDPFLKKHSAWTLIIGTWLL